MALLKVLQVPCYDVNSEPPHGASLWLQIEDHEYDQICTMGVYLHKNFHQLSLQGKRSKEPIPKHFVKAWCYYPNTLVQH